MMGSKSRVEGRFMEVKVDIGRGVRKMKSPKHQVRAEIATIRSKRAQKSSNPNNFGLIRKNLSLPGQGNSVKIEM